MIKPNRNHSAFILYPLLASFFTTLFRTLPYILIPDAIERGYRNLRFFLQILADYFVFFTMILLLLSFIFIIGNGPTKSFPIQTKKDVFLHVGIISLFVIIGDFIYHSLMILLLLWQNMSRFSIETSTETLTIYQPLMFGSEIEFSQIYNIIIYDFVEFIDEFFIIAIIILLFHITSGREKNVKLYPDEDKTETKVTEQTLSVERQQKLDSKITVSIPIGLAIISLIYYISFNWMRAEILYGLDNFEITPKLFLYMVISTLLIQYILILGLSWIAFRFLMYDKELLDWKGELIKIAKHLLIIFTSLAIFPIIIFIIIWAERPLNPEAIPLFENLIELLLLSTFYYPSDSLVIFLFFNMMTLLLSIIPVILGFTLVRLLTHVD